MSDFDDVGRFHNKFGLRKTGPREIPGPITPEARDFRLKFLLEELEELAEGYGMTLTWTLSETTLASETPAYHNGYIVPQRSPQDLPKIADALVDLVYVALGTAHLHALPWSRLWADVQNANMAKERCGINHKHLGPYDLCLHTGLELEGPCMQPKIKHSLRGNALDVIKPAGWKAPDPHGVLTAYGWPGPPLPGMPAQDHKVIETAKERLAVANAAKDVSLPLRPLADDPCPDSSSHSDPDNSGLCIYCGAILDGEAE